MSAAPPWTDLTDVDAARWITATLKGTTTDVELVVLHHDADSGATVSLVRFPAGLSREQLGCYPAAEELAILDGSLEFAGHTFVPGDYAFVPPFVVRTPMRSPDGLLVLAWFSGAPDWLTDEAARRPGEVVRRALVPGVLREASEQLPGRTVVVAPDAFEAVSDVGRDVFEVATGRWCFVPAGVAAPAVAHPVQVRTWF